MFYYPNVLNHRSGCFATIWLAATKGKKINRRDLCQVNIQRTCNDIMNYILVQVPPLRPGLPRPRLSLYLSSQLQFGVVFVYHKQCGILLEDIHLAIDRLLRTSKKRIDIVEDTGPSQSVPSALALFEETEGARDPFFGVMDFGYGLLSPTTLMQLTLQMGVSTPEHAPTAKSESTPSDGLTASQESITLPEREPVTFPEPGFEGAEFQEFDMTDMLLEQPDDFLEGEGVPRAHERDRVRDRERDLRQDRELEIGRGERERRREREPEREQERAADVERTTEFAASTISTEPLQATTASSRDPEMLPDEDSRLPLEMPETAGRERTPVPQPTPPSLPSVEEERAIESRERAQERDRQRERRLESASLEIQDVTETPKAPKRKKRQILFIDEETQIPQEDLQALINDVQTETRRLEDVLLKPPSQRGEDPKVLLSSPCSELPPDILTLWKWSTTFTSTPTSMAQARARGMGLDDDEEREGEMERERLEEGEPLDEMAEKDKDSELSSKEVPRELVESGLSQPDISVPSVETLEASERERDVSPLLTPETRGLEDIPEERVEPLEPEMFVDLDEPQRLLIESLDDQDEVTFHSLLPLKASRRTVAQAFWRLLERIEAKEVTALQEDPYADIVIRPGRHL